MVPKSEFLSDSEIGLGVQPSVELMCHPMAGFDPLSNGQQLKISIAQLHSKICNLSDQLNIVAALFGRDFQKRAIFCPEQMLLIELGSSRSSELAKSYGFGNIETQSSLLQKIQTVSNALKKFVNIIQIVTKAMETYVIRKGSE